MPGGSDITGKERRPDAESQIAPGNYAIRRASGAGAAPQEIVVGTSVSCVAGGKISHLARGDPTHPPSRPVKIPGAIWRGLTLHLFQRARRCRRL